MRGFSVSDTLLQWLINRCHSERAHCSSHCRVQSTLRHSVSVLVRQMTTISREHFSIFRFLGEKINIRRNVICSLHMMVSEKLKSHWKSTRVRRGLLNTCLNINMRDQIGRKK